MARDELRTCGDCGAEPGAYHRHGCDVERCPRCGGQKISCPCVYAVNGMDPKTLEETHPEIWKGGPTEGMYAKWDAEWGPRRIPWSGVWPGVEECREYGFWSKWVEGRGWVRCDASDPDATEDLNRLCVACVWDQGRQRWVRGVTT